MNYLKLLILSLSMFLLSNISAQEKPIMVTEKSNDDGSITLIAHNSSNSPIEVEIALTLRGITASKEAPIVEMVDGQGSKEMVTLKQTGSPASYSYSTSYSVRHMEPMNEGTNETRGSEVSIHSTDELIIPEKGIIVFSKNGCGRCTYAHNYLAKNNVDFKEINISTKSENADFFWDTLRKSGYNKKSVQTPVIVVDGKVHTKMSNLKEFLRQLAKK